MTTGDEEAENLVDNLFRDVDDQFKDLEREYSQAREDLVASDSERRGPADPLEASNERYELLSQVATLQAEVSRQADELDERDRMLAELGEKIAGFQSDIADRDEMLSELHEAKQSVLDERREQARLQALLDARAAERQELADVAHRLQNERDHVQELLTTSIARFDEIEAANVQLDDKMRHLEAARDTAAQEHDSRAHELIESRAEMSKLIDKIDEMARATTAADERAEKADALAERRANEAGYLNRRIDVLTEKLGAAGGFESDATELRRELNMSERRINELERTTTNQQAELEAANAAVEAIASRTSDYDEVVARSAELEQERDAAWEAASGYQPVAAPEPAVPSDEVAELADRARELGARRANEAEAAAQAAESAAAHNAAAAMAAADLADADAVATEAAEAVVAEPAAAEAVAIEATAAVVAEPAASEAGATEAPEAVVAEPAAAEAVATEAPEAAEVEAESELQDLDDGDGDLIDADLAGLIEPEPVAAAPEAVPVDDIPKVPYPVVQFEFASPDIEEFPNTSEIPVVKVDEIPVVNLDHLQAPTPVPVAAAVSLPGGIAGRKRTILPTDLVPNTAEAVAFLLSQPGVTAIVDARSTCGRTGIRPSELFDRIAMLRDQFDVPVEVVVTPVSTPVGGAPDLPAIGVHHVTGADTVADRVRALCMGFPADQPLVVIAGDDHVRRAAIGEEANVVEPSAVLTVTPE